MHRDNEDVMNVSHVVSFRIQMLKEIEMLMQPDLMPLLTFYEF